MDVIRTGKNIQASFAKGVTFVKDHPEAVKSALGIAMVVAGVGVVATSKVKSRNLAFYGVGDGRPQTPAGDPQDQFVGRDTPEERKATAVYTVVSRLRDYSIQTGVEFGDPDNPEAVKKAVKIFQRGMHLKKQTGVPDRETLKAMYLSDSVIDDTLRGLQGLK